MNVDINPVNVFQRDQRIRQQKKYYYARLEDPA